MSISLSLRNGTAILTAAFFGMLVELPFAQALSPRCSPGAPFALSAPISIPTPGNSYMYGVVAGDLNLDGRLDLVVASHNSSEGGILVLYATGPRSFGPHLPIAFMTPPFDDVALIDINRDGRLDILGIAETGDLYKFTNTPTGFEQAHTSIHVPGGSAGRYYLEVANMNASDQLPDLIASGREFAQILYGFYDGFSPGNIFSMHGHVRAGHFNDDSLLDLITVADTGYGPRADMMLTSGGGFVESHTPIPDSGNGFTTASRLNADLRTDLYVVNSSTQTITSYRQGMASTFQELRTVDRPDFFSHLAESADLDFDGYSDLVTDGYDGDMTLLLHRALGIREYDIPLYVTYDILLTDLDRDGRNDLIFGGIPSVADNAVVVLYNNTACLPPAFSTAHHVCLPGQC